MYIATCQTGPDVVPFTQFAEDSPPKGSASEGLRIALYSHDTMGLGHTRRNLLIAQALANGVNRADILLITGAHESSQFAMPSGVDCLTLPSLYKGSDGLYRAKALELSLEQLTDLRSRAIRAALKAFQPDLFIVDKVPWGAAGELRRVLKMLKKKGRTRCILGLRDVLDAPAFVQLQWRKEKSDEAIRSFYDAIWIYGDPAIYDLVLEYKFAPDIAKKARYLGYFDQRTRLEQQEESRSALDLPKAPFVLCQVGGGQDGQNLAETFVTTRLPEGQTGVLVTGPFMPKEVRQRLHARVKTRADMQIHEFVREPTALLKRAERVISMGGYNSVCEALSFEKPLLVVPRVQPRLEQLERAERMQALGLLDMLHPQDLGPERLAAWLQQEVKPPQVHGHYDFGALDKLQKEVQGLFVAPAEADCVSA